MKLNTIEVKSRAAARRKGKWRKFSWLLFCTCAISGGLFISACRDTKKDKAEDYLIRIGQRQITVQDFNKALEFAKTAYPHNVMQRPDVYRSIRVRLLNQLTEELVLLAKADELNIRVDEAELNAAIEEIKKDYPDNTFEEAFLENAVSFDAWKKRLEIRLLMERIIAVELADKIKITQEDIAAYYKQNYQGDAAELLSESEAANAAVVKSIRRSKAEVSYKDWIKKIKKKYSIEINKAQWDKIVGAE